MDYWTQGWDPPPLRDPKATPTLMFAYDCDYYGLYGTGQRGVCPRPLPSRLKAPPFHDLGVAAEHIERLRTTWTEKPTLLAAGGRATDVAEIVDRLCAFGLGHTEGEKATLRATPELSGSLWDVHCRLATTLADAATRRVALEWEARLAQQGGSEEARRLAAAVEDYYRRRGQPGPDGATAPEWFHCF